MSKRQRTTLLGAVGIVAILAAGIVFFSSGRGAAPAIGKEFTTYGICLACKHEAQISYPRDEYPPHRCPSCGKQAFFPLFFCETCKKRFVPELVRSQATGRLRLPDAVSTCPGCGGGDLSLFIPEAQAEKPVGDLPWPQWQE